MEEEKTEEEKGIIDLISSFFDLIWKFFVGIFKIIILLFKILRVLLIILVIWFGYIFYNNYTNLSTGDGFDPDTVNSALTLSLEEVRDIFDVPYNIISPIFTNKYADNSLKEVYIEERGIPEIYIIMISYDKINKEGVPVEREKPLIFETWTYGKPHNKQVIFENGFFLEEKDLPSEDVFLKNSLDPTNFRADITKEEALSLLGVAECKATEDAGSDILTTYRFKETESRPVSSVTFLNEKLIFLSVGIVFTGDENGQLCE